jgi:hypothetical protein
MRRSGGLAAGEQRQRCLMKHGARCPNHMTALVFQPHLEAGAAAKGHPFQQFLAEPGKRDSLHPGAAGEKVDVDECPRRQGQAQRVATEPDVLAQPTPQGGERPAERSQGILCLGEQQGCEPLPGR